MPSAYKFSALLTVREQALAQAEQELRQARQALHQAEGRSLELAVTLATRQAKHEASRAARQGNTAGQLQAQTAYVARLAAEVEAAEQQAAAYRRGPLLQAESALAAAVAAHDHARQEVKLISQHRDQFEEGQERQKDRQHEAEVQDTFRSRP